MDPMASKRAALALLLTELAAFEEGMKGEKPPTQTEAEAMDAKAEEAEAIQKELKAHDDRTKRFQDIAARGGFDPGLPPDNQPDPKAAPESEKIEGYMTIGEYVIAQGMLQKFLAAGAPKGASFELAKVPNLLRGRGERMPMVPLTGKQIRGLMETKAVPTIGGGIIEPMRVPDMAKVTEFDQLRLRDILNIGQTSSSSVSWVQEVSFTRSADPVAHGALKPEGSKEYHLQSAAVATIAAWIPVHDQMLSDWPALQGEINSNLLYDLEKRVEELITWGDGVGLNFLGWFADPLVWSCGQMDLVGGTRVVAGDTLIDIIRKGITDVRVAGYNPNGVLLHPYDWETVETLKATDNKYIWSVVTEAGVSRLWGVPVIETEACQDFTGAATEARNLLVGDFTRGATLWDRMQSTVSVGWQDDQFVRNMRTILAELRAAWAIRRPKAFRDWETQAQIES